jgi:hypothetical protein
MLLLFSFTTARAERAEWGYCGGKIADTKQGAAVGRSGNNTWVDCCIRIPAEKLAFFSGNRVTAVRVGLMDTAPQVDSIVVWVRSAKEEANLVEAKQYGVQEGWNEVALPAGYPIDGSTDLYVGFSYYQKKKITAISLAGTPTADGAWTCLNGEWNNGYASRGALAVEAVIEGEQLPHRSVALTSAALSMNRYPVGHTITCTGTLENPVIDTLRTVVMAYTFDDDTTVAGYDTVSVEVPFLGATTFRSVLSTSGLSAGVHTVHLVPTLPAEAPADRPTSGAADLTFNLAEGLFARNALIEEFTSEYCSNCPSGAERIHAALSSSDLADQVVMLCHHAAYGYDWLSNDTARAYEQLFTPYRTFAPAMTLDRTYIDGISEALELESGDTVYATVSGVEDAATIRRNFETHIAEMSLVGVSLTAHCADGLIHIEVTGERNSAFVNECATPRLTVIIKEDGIAAIQQFGATGAYTHNNVTRAAVTDVWGDRIAWDGDRFTMQYTTAADPDWDATQLSAVAFVSNYNPDDRLDCVVYNAAETPIEVSTAALQPIHPTAQTPIAQYYTALDGTRLTRGHGLCVRHTRYADGTVRVEKVMVK